jgi:hypothetical protein
MIVVKQRQVITFALTFFSPMDVLLLPQCSRLNWSTFEMSFDGFLLFVASVLICFVEQQADMKYVNT